jgi:glycosyl transferase family 25
LLTLLINLDRRPDRLADMTDQLHRQGIAFERVAARDGAAYPEQFATERMSNAERACHVSHRACWQRLIESGEPRALVLEDDLVLSPRFGEFLARPEYFPADADIIKLETALHEVRLSRKAFRTPCGLTVRRLRTLHLGAAAYMISREAAAALLAVDRSTDLPVDIFLQEYRSASSEGLGVYQVVPALAVQGILDPKYSPPSTTVSDIAADRRERALRGEAAVLAAFHANRRRKPSFLRSAYYRFVFREWVGPIAFDGALASGS